jgi:glutathione peroxidase
MKESKAIYGFTVTTLDGREMQLSAYRGKVLLIVNTASKCGLTPQYEGLEKLYRKHKEQGLVVLGFPCNQFLSQEPGPETEIASFCSLHYEVTFPLFRKVDVNGGNTHPLYRFLKEKKPGLWRSRAIKWNFTKFLVDRSGEVIRRYAPWISHRSFSRKSSNCYDLRFTTFSELMPRTRYSYAEIGGRRYVANPVSIIVKSEMIRRLFLLNGALYEREDFYSILTLTMGW